MVKKNQVFRNIVICIFIISLISIGFSLANVKHFDYEFQVNKDDSSIDIEKVMLKGKLTKFPLNINYIKGTLIIGEKDYAVNKYKKVNYPSELNITAYRIYFNDKENRGSIYGKGRLYGNIYNDNVKSMYITIDIMDMVSGHSETEHINCSLIKSFQ